MTEERKKQLEEGAKMAFDALISAGLRPSDRLKVEGGTHDSGYFVTIHRPRKAGFRDLGFQIGPLPEDEAECVRAVLDRCVSEREATKAEVKS